MSGEAISMQGAWHFLQHICLSDFNLPYYFLLSWAIRLAGTLRMCMAQNELYYIKPRDKHPREFAANHKEISKWIAELPKDLKTRRNHAGAFKGWSYSLALRGKMPDNYIKKARLGIDSDVSCWGGDPSLWAQCHKCANFLINAQLRICLHLVCVTPSP